MLGRKKDHENDSEHAATEVNTSQEGYDESGDPVAENLGPPPDAEPAAEPTEVMDPADPDEPRETSATSEVSEHTGPAMPRRRGAVLGVLLVLLGGWGATIPYVGATFDFGYTPNDAFEWTAGRFWLQLLPGVLAAFGGLILLLTRSRVLGTMAGAVAASAGAWFVIGPVLAAEELGDWSDIGQPLGNETQRTVEQLTMFFGLGCAVLLLAAIGLGRMTLPLPDPAVAGEQPLLAPEDGPPQQSFAAPTPAAPTRRSRRGKGRHEVADPGPTGAEGFPPPPPEAVGGRAGTEPTAPS